MYIDDNFKDYDESSHPWKKQSTSSDSEEFVDGFCPKSGSLCSDHQSLKWSNVEKTSMIIQSLSQQEDKASIESDYTSDTSSQEETTISRNTVIDCTENSLCPQSHEFEDISKLSQCDSWECFSGARITDVGCRKSASLNDALLVNDSLIMNSASLDEDTSHFDSCGLVDSLDKMTVEESPCKYVSIGTQTITDMGTDGVSVLLSDNVAHEEKDVDGKLLSAENNHPVVKLKQEKIIEISVKDLEVSLKV